MSKRISGIIGLFVYTAIISFSAFHAGRSNLYSDTAKIANTSHITTEEEYYTVVEKDNKLALFKDGEMLMSLDTNVEMLPAIVRSQLKKGVDFKASELPVILEALAE